MDARRGTESRQRAAPTGTCTRFPPFLPAASTLASAALPAAAHSTTCFSDYKVRLLVWVAQQAATSGGQHMEAQEVWRTGPVRPRRPRQCEAAR